MKNAARKTERPIRVVLAEDQAMVLGALAALLEIEEDIAVVGQARNGKAALDAVAEQKPDVLITDIEMPEMSGLEVAAELKRQRAATRTIILTTFARSGYLRRDVLRLINQDRNSFAACYVACGYADGMVTGVTRAYDQALEEVLRVIDPAPGGRLIGM